MTAHTIAERSAAHRRRTLRIAHVLPWSELGGTEVATSRLVGGLGRRGHAQDIYVASEGPALPLFTEQGVTPRVYPSAELSFRRPRRFLQANVKMAASLARRYDVVHFANLLAALQLPLASVLARVPAVCHVRGTYPELRKRDRMLLRSMKKFVFVSEATRQAFGSPEARRCGVVIRDGIVGRDVPSADVERVRKDFGLSPARPTVGMIARVGRGKDFESFIRSAARLSTEGRDAMFLACGPIGASPDDQEYYRALLQLRDQLHLRDQLLFTGPRDDVAAVFAACDVVVLASEHEGLPLSVLEAMALGRPVVASNVGGLAELIDDGISGLLVAPRNVDALTSAIRRVLSDQDLAARLGREARRRVSEQFGESTMLDRIENVYRECARASS
jgi:glycosyltransferase involved in cell wall biosynthesis